MVYTKYQPHQGSRCCCHTFNFGLSFKLSSLDNPHPNQTRPYGLGGMASPGLTDPMQCPQADSLDSAWKHVHRVISPHQTRVVLVLGTCCNTFNLNLGLSLSSLTRTTLIRPYRGILIQLQLTLHFRHHSPCSHHESPSNACRTLCWLNPAYPKSPLLSGSPSEACHVQTSTATC